MFQITQHSRDEKLIESLINYGFAGCGRLARGSDNKVQFRVEKFSDNYEIIRKFFGDNKIIGVKYKDFQDWSFIAQIMQNREHLTKQGLEKVIKIKEGMNKGRA